MPFAFPKGEIWDLCTKLGLMGQKFGTYGNKIWDVDMSIFQFFCEMLKLLNDTYSSDFLRSTWTALRISYRVSIESRDLQPFHSIEQYQVSNPQY